MKLHQSAFSMPDLRPRLRWSFHSPPPDAPTMEFVFEAEGTGDAMYLLARRRPVPTFLEEDAWRSLIALGASAEGIQVVPVGIERAWRGEVVGQWPAPGERVDPETRILIFVARSGLQHRLPDGILPSVADQEAFGAPAIEPAGAADELLLEHRELDPARRLLVILDGWLARARASITLLGEALGDASSDPDWARHLLALVGLGGLPLDDMSARWLAGSIPRLPSTVGTAEPSGEVLSEIFDVRACIGEGPPVRVEIPDELRTRLGRRNNSLGGTFCLGRSVEDARPAARVTFGPESAAEATAMVRLPKQRGLLAACEAALLPVLSAPQRRHEILEDERRLRPGGESSCSALGVTTFFRDASRGGRAGKEAGGKAPPARETPSVV